MPIPYNISQSPVPVGISGTPTGATQRQAYSWSPTVTGGFGVRTFTMTGNLPERMTFNPFTGTIAGIPRHVISVSGLSITVTDASGSATLSNLTIPVASAISNLMITGTPDAATVGSAYTFTPTVTGGSGPRTYSFSGRLEDGLSFNPATGAISGTPTEDGGSFFIITVQDSVDTATLSGTIVASYPGGGVVPVNPPLPNYASIVAFGNSVTFGLNSTNAATTSWAALTAANVGGTLLNQGSSGSVFQDSPDSTGYSRESQGFDNGFDRYRLALTGASKKAAAFVVYGLNDARYTGGGQINVSNFTREYQAFARGMILAGYSPTDFYVGSPYYLTDTGLNTGGAGFTGQTRSGFEAYVSAVASVASEYGLKYCDLYAATNNATYNADVAASDNIHPRDVGHAIIANAWKTNTIVANAKARASVSATGGLGTIAAVANAAGAASYEYSALSGHVVISSNTSGNFTGLAPGSYNVMARAVFADTTKGPWGFTASPVTVTSAATSGTVIFNDTFTDTNGATLLIHAPELGGSYEPCAVNVSVTNVPPIFYVTTGRIFNNRASSASPGTSVCVYRNAAQFPTADYYVEAVVDFVSTVTTETVGVGARMDATAETYYWARWSQSAGGFQLFKTVAGTSTQLGATYTDAFGSGSRTMRLLCVGTAISLLIDGVSRVSVTDASITAIGYGGIRSTYPQTSVSGHLMTSLTGVVA